MSSSESLRLAPLFSCIAGLAFYTVFKINNFDSDTSHQLYWWNLVTLFGISFLWFRRCNSTIHIKLAPLSIMYAIGHLFSSFLIFVYRFHEFSQNQTQLIPTTHPSSFMIAGLMNLVLFFNASQFYVLALFVDFVITFTCDMLTFWIGTKLVLNAHTISHHLQQCLKLIVFNNKNHNE